MSPFLLLAATLALAAEAPPILFIADGRGEPGECRQLTLFARLLTGETGLSDLQDLLAEKEDGCARFRDALLPPPGGFAPEIAGAAAGKSLHRVVAGIVGNRGAGAPEPQEGDDREPLATCILLDPATGAVLARAARGPPLIPPEDLRVSPPRAALARALGEVLGSAFAPLEVTLAGLEALRRSGDAVGAEGTAMALLAKTDDPRIHRIIALAKETRGDWEGARSHWSDAVRAPSAGSGGENSSPAEWTFSAGLARVEERLGDPVSAASHYDRALERCPEDVRARLLEARKALESERRREEDRRSAWQRALRRTEALRAESAALGRKRAAEEASSRRALEERVRLSAGDLSARLALGARYLAERRFAAAESEFARVVEADLSSGAARLALGRALFLRSGPSPAAPPRPSPAGSRGTGPQREARTVLEEAARLLPLEAEPLILLGDLLARAEGGPDPRWSEHRGGVPAFDLEAFAWPESVSKNQPPSALRRPSGAEEGEAAHSGRSRAADVGGGSASPTNQEAQSLSNSCSGSESKTDASPPAAAAGPGGEPPPSAGDLYRRALERAPGDARALARTADWLLRAGDAGVGEGLRAARRAVEIGGYSDARRVLASALRLRGERRDAEREMALFLAETARNTIERERTLRRLRSLGLPGAAERIAAEGLAVDPASHLILFERARLRFGSGRPEEALEDFRAALILAAGGLNPGKFPVPLVTEFAEMLLSLERPAEARAELAEPLKRLAAEESRLRASRLPAEGSALRGEATRPPSFRQEPVDFPNPRDRATWARLRLLAGRARRALGDRQGAKEDFRWAARVLAVERGRVRPEAEWPAALSAPAREIASESVAHLGLLLAEEGDRAGASALVALASRLAAEPAGGGPAPSAESPRRVPTALSQLEEALR